ncbi:MAG: sodium:proton antiporter [Thermoleophilia bacterium]
MTQEALVGIAAVVVLGIGSQWLAWRLHMPSILLLLLTGILAGPVIGVLDPDALLGDLLRPFVSFAVAVILFEGGLSLRVRDLREVGLVVRNLVTIGVAVTWGVAGFSAHFVLGLEPYLAALLGAILTVTGPTVVIPLLQQVRPVERVGAVLRWEGIVVDPIGAVLSVLAFEVALLGEIGGLGEAVTGLIWTFFLGSSLGLAAAVVMVLLLRHYWIPDYLQNSVALALVIAIAALANSLQEETGLVAVTVMGVALANQSAAQVRHIIEFKGNLGVLLLGLLFIVLAARLDLQALLDTLPGGLVFLAILIVVARPLAVFLSTWGSDLTRKERIFLAAVAPRGIVAASVASVFTLELVSAGNGAAEPLVSFTFMVIIATVALYGSLAAPLARYLGLAKPDPHGVLIVGAHGWARDMAAALQAEGLPVRLVDTNRADIRAAKLAGLDAQYGSILSESLADRMDLSDYGRLLALTPNDEVNSLACLHFLEVFGRANVFQLAPAGTDQKKGVRDDMPMHLHGRTLFHDSATFRYLQERFSEGASLKATKLSEEFDYDDFERRYAGEALPLFALPESGGIQVATTDQPLRPRPGQKVISLVGPMEL